MTITCHGGPLDGKEIVVIPEVAERARISGALIPICEGELEGLYRVDGERLVFAGQLP